MMGVIFGLFGVPMLAGAMIVAGRSLRVRLAGGRIEQIRYFAGRPLWRREAELTSASRLELHKASSLNKGEETVIYYHLAARVWPRSLRVRGRFAGPAAGGNLPRHPGAPGPSLRVSGFATIGAGYSNLPARGGR